MTFANLGLSAPILQAVEELGYSEPTAIQQQSIPPILDGRDLLATAQTGTGKTASFVLPILEHLQGIQTRKAKRVKALILVPTRELALQVESNVWQYSKHLDLRALAMVGGVDGEQQKQQLIDGVDILVATPGRLLDMLHQRAVHFDQLEVLVLDEADRMLDMGFIGDINKIVDRLPVRRQNLLFSATLSPAVSRLAKATIDNPVEVAVTADKAALPRITQWLATVDKANKSSLLSHLIKDRSWSQGLIFIRTKHGAAKLVDQLGKRGIAAECIHSGKSQAVRTQLMADFKAGKICFLIATGIAARGIDIDDLRRVINYDLPDDADDYIHRIGRTGRAGNSGEAVSLISKDDFKRLCAIESRIGHIIERQTIEGFEAVKEVPVSILNYVKKSARSGKPAEKKPRRHEKNKRGKAYAGKTQKADDRAVVDKQKKQSTPVKKDQDNTVAKESRREPLLKPDSEKRGRSDPWSHWKSKG